MPSNHVCSKFGSPTSPHPLYQVAPRKQQLSLPDGLETHLGQVIGGAVAVVASVFEAAVSVVVVPVVVLAVVVVVGGPVDRCVLVRETDKQISSITIW